MYTHTHPLVEPESVEQELKPEWMHNRKELWSAIGSRKKNEIQHLHDIA